MKRYIAVATILALFSTSVSTAASISGTTCSKAGLVKTVKTQNFKCQKVKGKLKWVLKSTKSAAPVVAPSPTPTPTLTATPTVTPTPSPTPTPTVEQTPVTAPGAPFEVVDFPLIGKIAKENFLKLNASEKSVIEVAWDPTTTEAKRKWMGAQIDAIKKYYSALIPEGGNLKIVVMGADVEWSREQIRILANDNPDIWRDYNDRFFVSTKCANPDGYVITDNKWPEPYTTYRGLGGGTIPGKAFAFVTMSNCDAYIEKDILFHEAFHSVQWLNSYITAKYLGNRSFGWGILPPWMKEGQAEYIGLRLANDFKDPSVVYDSGGVIWWNALPTYRWKTEYDYLTTYDTSDPYWIGAIMQEYLIAKFGIERVMTIYDATVKKDKEGNFDSATRYDAFDEAFSEVFGQTRKSFVNEVKPYIQWSMDLQKNR